MKVSTLSQKALDELSQGMELIEVMRKNEDFFECIKAITSLMEIMKEDKEFVKALSDLRNSTKNLWRAKIENTKK